MICPHLRGGSFRPFPEDLKNARAFIFGGGRLYSLELEMSSKAIFMRYTSHSALYQVWRTLFTMGQLTHARPWSSFSSSQGTPFASVTACVAGPGFAWGML